MPGGVGDMDKEKDNNIYEEIEIEDMIYDENDYSYSYPCPCGDQFRITLEDLHDGDNIAKCPSCTLRIRVIYDVEDLPELPPDDDDEEADEEADEDQQTDDLIQERLAAIKVAE